MEKQLVIFNLGKECFGIEIAAVEGIVKMDTITKIPRCPPYMEGISNLRGSVIPIIDLHKRFNMGAQEITDETRIVITNVNGVKIGMIVSSVNEVLTIDSAQIEPPPSLGTSMNSEFITGIAKVDQHLVILLDLGKILSVEEVNQAAKVVTKAA